MEMTLDPDHELNTLLSFYTRTTTQSNSGQPMLSKSRSAHLPVLELPPPTKFMRKQNRTSNTTFVAAFATGPSSFSNHQPSSLPSGPMMEDSEDKKTEGKYNLNGLLNYDLLFHLLTTDYPDSLQSSNALNSK